jgi:hypothetical protein
MTERVMSIDALPEYFVATFRTKQVRVRENGSVVTIEPAEEIVTEKKYRCPLLGIAKDSNLTVENFLEWKREDRKREYERELHS